MSLGNFFLSYDLIHKGAATYPHLTWASMGNCVVIDFSLSHDGIQGDFGYVIINIFMRLKQLENVMLQFVGPYVLKCLD